MSVSICNCGKPIHPARIDYGFANCIDCANENPVEPPKGRMVYDGKVGAQIEIMSAETWRENKSRFMPHGARSAVKNFSKNVSA
jgi:hypothetical protein